MRKIRRRSRRTDDRAGMEKLCKISVGDREARRTVEDKRTQILAAQTLIGRMIGNLHLHLDSGLGKLSLDDLHDGLLPGIIRDNGLYRNSVFMAGLGEQRLRLGEIERITAGAVLAEIAGR